jgi:hypothetical protein
MEIKYTLKAFHTKGDKFGNVYWAFRFHEVSTGKTVTGKISGGESNIYGILRHWDSADDWDRSISFEIEQVKESTINKIKDYAGCTSLGLAKYIRSKLAEFRS